MAYVPGVTNDIFVSYAHIDNEAPSDKERWVRRFVSHLDHELRLRIGLGSKEELKIFFDERSLHSNDHLDMMKDNARRSAAFVAIVSPTYVVREWPQEELKAFLEMPNSGGRVFAIESLPPERSYPDALKNLVHTKFWMQREHSDTKQRLTPDEDSWISKIQDVAEHIKALLRKLREAGGIDLAKEIPLAMEIISEPKRTVLLAEVTDDLNDDRDQLRRFIEQYSISTLPLGTYQQGGQDFAKAFEADIAKANFFVQLIGQHASRRPPDVPQGYARYQYEIAKREAAKRDLALLLWRRPDVDQATVVHNDRELLSAPEMLTMGFETFKAEIVRQVNQHNATKKSDLKRNFSSDILVFINAVHEDQEIAHSVQKDFERNGCTALLPLYGGEAGELRDDLEEKIIWCDALALVYGEAEPRWISNQVMAYSKLKRKRNEPARVVLICRAPPQPKQKHGVAMPELREIDYSVDAPNDAIKNVLRELRR